MTTNTTTARLEGKVAIITGSGAGLGAECAHVLAANGARVVVADINFESATETAAAIVAAGGEAMAWRTDVTSEDDIRALVAAVMARFGRHLVRVNKKETD